MAKNTRRGWYLDGAKAGVAAVLTWLATSLGTSAWAASYSAITVPGSLLGDNWTVTKNLLSKNGDGTWSGTFTTTTDNGEFKFAANKAWTVNWGGASDLVIARLPATGPLAQGGSNIGVKGVPTGTAVTFTFNDSALTFDLTGAASAGANLQSAQVVGAFNSFGSGSTAGTMTETTDGLWEADVTLSEGTTIQLLVKPSGATTTERWGPPYAQMVAASATEALGWSMCGSSTGTLSVAASGKYHFTFDEETLMLYVAAPLAAVTLPGDLLGEWSETQCPLANNGDGLWTGTYPTITNNGAFKVAANNSWDVNWGGPTELTITRLPATGIGPLVQGGGNIFVQGQPTGTELTFNFDETTKTCDVLGTAASAGANLKSAQVIGDFNNYGKNSAEGVMSETRAGIWECDVTLGEGTSVQLAIVPARATDSERWGPPGPWTVAANTNGTAVSWPMCGTGSGSLEIAAGGTFHFTFDEETLTLYVEQTSVLVFQAEGMSVDGNWQGPRGLANGANLTQAGQSYSSSFWVTNANGTTLTLLFSERNAAGATGGLYYGYSTDAAMSPASLSAGYSGTAVASSDRSALQPFQFKSAGPGMYEVTFNKTSLAVEVNRKYAQSTTSKVNLLDDPGCEQLDDNSFPTKWGYWNARMTTNAWHSGKSAGYLSQLAATSDQNHGGLTFDVPVNSSQWGATYRLSAYFKKTADWSSSAHVILQIEWRKPSSNENGFDVVGSDQTDVDGLTTWSWTYGQLETDVPEGAATAHAVIMYNDASDTGAIFVDDAELRVASSRIQTFDTWTGRQSGFGPFSPDWSIQGAGKTIDNAMDLELGPGGVFFAKYIEGRNNNKALEIFNASTQSVNLAEYSLVFYTNGATTYAAADTIALSGTLGSGESFVISQEKGYFPTNMDPAAEIIAASDMQTHRLTFNGDDVVVLMKGTKVVDRIGQVGANAWTSFNAFVMRDHTLSRVSWQGFGTTNAVTAEWPLWDEWIIDGVDETSGLGEFVRTLPLDVYVPSGLSLILHTDSSIVTPELSGGVGDLTFWYRAATATNTANATIHVEISEDNSSWTEVTNVTVKATDTAWQSFSFYLNAPAASWLRLRSEATLAGLVRLDDITVEASVVESRRQTFEDWTTESWQQYHGTYNQAGWQLVGQVATNSGGLCARLGAGDSIISPLYGSGGAGTITLVISGDTNITQAIQVSISTNKTDWTPIGDVLPVGTGLRTDVDANVGGAVAVKFEAVCDEDQFFTVDDIQVRVFEGGSVSRTQAFEKWKADTTYTNRSGQGWSCVGGAIVNREGTQALQMRDTGSYLLSPALPGIGTLTFTACPLNSSHHPILLVKTSPDGKTWTTNATIQIPSSQTNMAPYSISIQDTRTLYVQFYLSGNDKHTVLLDNINAAAYKQPGNVSMTPGITPDPPALESNYRFTGSVQPVGASTIEKVQMLYQLKPPSSAGYKSQVYTNSLTYDGGEGLYLSGANAPQPTNTLMRYWLRVTWSTVSGSTVVTNVSLSATNETAFSSVAGGKVWINEIAYLATPDDMMEDPIWGEDMPGPEKHEFIELCGPAGTDIGGWKVQLMLTRSGEVDAAGSQIYATYTIPNGVTLPTDITVSNATGASSYGFYVLGDNAKDTKNPLKNVDLYFTTNFVPTSVISTAVEKDNHIHDSGMIRLQSKYRATIDTLVYGRAYNGQYAGAQVNDGHGSLGASGEGSSASDFTDSWTTTNAFTVGNANVGQELTVSETAEKSVPLGLFHEAARCVMGGMDTFYMIDTKVGDTSVWPVDMRQAVRFFVGGPQDIVDDDCSGVLYVREGTSGEFSSQEVTFTQGAGDGTNNFLSCTAFSAGELSRLETLQYYFEVDADSELYLAAFVGADSNGVATCATYANAEEARSNPFTFVVPFPDFDDPEEPLAIDLLEFNRQTGKATITSTLRSSFPPLAEEIELQSCTNLVTPKWEKLDSIPNRVESGERTYTYTYTFEPPTTNGMWAIRLKPALQPPEE
ncbi:MAG: lamin tail domain-containing protein [Kiritimatiellae bacterium]|nr:lamin tail domain-containing protein [Kiritimatiellia bacterium]